jgi:hypothetical protein
MEKIRHAIPRKPKHVDILSQKRRARQAKIRDVARKRGIRTRKGERYKTSFKQYWRENAPNASIHGAVPGRPRHNRKTRRRWVKEWYHKDRQEGEA